MSTLTAPGSNARREIGSRWAWIIVLGVALVALGIVAFLNLPMATRASVYAIGILMVMAAVGQLVAAILVRRAGMFVLLLLAAVLYGIGGYFTFTNPDVAAEAFTLVLAISLIVSGVLRASWSLTMRSFSGWGWWLASGIVTLIAGVLFLTQWPIDSVWLLGLVLAVDLVMQGSMAIGFGLGLRRMRD